MFGLGAGEILVIMLMAIVFIGPKKLPELSRNLGKALREFQKTKDSVMESLQNTQDDLLEGGAGPEDDDKVVGSVAIKPEPVEKPEDSSKNPEAKS